MAVRISSDTIFAIFVDFTSAKTRECKAVRQDQKCLTRSRLNSPPKLFEDICKDYYMVVASLVITTDGFYYFFFLQPSHGITIF